MIDNQVEDFLEHFGIMGMKWGVRSGASQVAGLGDAAAAQNMRVGIQMAKNLLHRAGETKMSDVPTLNEMRYSVHWYNIHKVIEFAVDATR